MTNFTTNQWAILALVLLLGWLLGLMSRSGGGKWRRAYETERSDHIATRSAHDAELATAKTRIAELERTASASAAAAASSSAMTTSRHRDDLSLIHGVGRSGESRLNDLGLHRYQDISGLTTADEAALESRIGAEPGTIARERWREQADMLANNRLDEHRRLFS